MTEAKEMIRILAIVGVLLGSACAGANEDAGRDANRAAEKTRAAPKIVVVSRTQAMANYPCEQCHRHTDATRPSSLTAHSEVRVRHMPGATCETCHDPDEPSRLQLVSGQGVPLENAHLLCAQCHFVEAADWKVGIHGKQVGNWLHEIHRFSCTRCHDPHEPKFRSMQAAPAPPFPAMGIPKEGH